MTLCKSRYKIITYIIQMPFADLRGYTHECFQRWQLGITIWKWSVMTKHQMTFNMSWFILVACLAQRQLCKPPFDIRCQKNLTTNLCGNARGEKTLTISRALMINLCSWIGRALVNAFDNINSSHQKDWCRSCIAVYLFFHYSFNMSFKQIPSHYERILFLQLILEWLSWTWSPNGFLLNELSNWLYFMYSQHTSVVLF